jgi:hypothetical protein
VLSSGTRITLRRPDRGPHIISTRPIDRLRVESAVASIGGLALTAVAGVSAAVVMIGHFV